jgi:hypothetical protein
MNKVVEEKVASVAALVIVLISSALEERRLARSCSCLIKIEDFII